MSAPETNLEKQKRRHGPVLITIIAAVAIFVAASIATGTFVEDQIEDDAAPDPVVPAEQG